MLLQFNLLGTENVVAVIFYMYNSMSFIYSRSYKNSKTFVHKEFVLIVFLRKVYIDRVGSLWTSV